MHSVLLWSFNALAVVNRHTDQMKYALPVFVCVARSVDAPVVHAAKEVELLQAGDSSSERPVRVVVKGKLLEEAFGLRSEIGMLRDFICVT